MAKQAASSLRTRVLEDLARSGLSEADAKRLCIKPMSEAESKKLKLTHAAEGYVIPYFDAKGKKTNFFRYRYLVDVRTPWEKASKAKGRKYEQPKKTAPEIYLPPFVKWTELQNNTETPLVITEGEKKAASATKAGIPTIGLGGVWSFQQKKSNTPLLPSLLEFEWRERLVYIVYDSDAAVNPQVKMAERRLAEELLKLGAIVHVVRLPGGTEGKVGLDDYLVQEGEQALRNLLNEADEFAECRALHEMNEKVVLSRSEVVVYSLEHGIRMSPHNFQNVLYANEEFVRITTNAKGEEKRQVMSTAKEWLKWKGRAEVPRFVYEPGESRPIASDGSLNLWPGFPYTPEPGDVSPWTELLDRLFDGEAESRRWFEQWVAYPFQHPGTKLRSAAVIWSIEQGTGKSLLGFTIGDLYGQNFVKIGDQELENPQFNDWQANKQFVLGDDITGQSSRKLANRLKVMITSETVRVNEKYVAAYQLRDCINYMFTSNHPDAFYMEEGDRRYFIHEVKADKLPPSFYQPYDRWRRSTEGRRALMAHLLSVDLKGFDPMAPALVTRSKREMIENTRTDVEDFIIGLREDPDPVLKRFGGGDLITSKELMACIDPGGTARINEVTVGKKMKEYRLEAVLPTDSKTTSVRIISGERVRFYPLKNAAKWRKATCAELRAHYEKHRPNLKRG